MKLEKFHTITNASAEEKKVNSISNGLKKGHSLVFGDYWKILRATVV